VQGVGFRPFVHGLAERYGLSGFVLNDPDGVLAEIEGAATGPFLTALRQGPPPLAHIDQIDVTAVELDGQCGFSIRAGYRAVPGLLGRNVRPGEPLPPLPVHHLHAMRPALHDH
jgi:hydrogenase maturation factor HypF (carbamoyltransferase family)